MFLSSSWHMAELPDLLDFYHFTSGNDCTALLIGLTRFEHHTFHQQQIITDVFYATQ